MAMSLQMNCIKIIIMQLSNKLFKLIGILVQMNIGHLGCSETGSHSLGLLPLPLGLFLLLLQHLVLAFDRFHLLGNSVDLVLHCVLLLYHLSFQRDVESPLVIFLSV